MIVGENVHFGVDSYIQAGGRIRVGDFTEMGPGVKIWSQNHLFDDPEQVLEGAGYEYKPVSIGRNVWIGANAFIMPGVDIEDGCVISAGAVVGVKKWPSNSIIAGNPARKIGERGGLRKQAG
jgi:acetyltransferase-like isoleucine patch superfamily enzyme